MRHGIIAGMLSLALAATSMNSALAQTLIADWNLNWLTVDNPDKVPPNQPRRGEAGFAGLRNMARDIGADVFAFEEVDGKSAAEAVFDKERYNFEIADGPEIQRVGMAIDKKLTYTRHPDLSALDVGVDALGHHLRTGLDVTLHLASGDLRVLVVHLKSGCFNDAIHSDACPLLKKQEPIVAKWIADRQAAKEAFLLAGDFNHAFSADDSFWKLLNDQHPVVDLAGLAVPSCYNHKHDTFIDHFVVAKADEARFSGFREFVYPDGTDPNQLSDHCPIAVTVK